MSIIITGGTGLIGKALATDLAQTGQEVFILTRFPQKSYKLPANVHFEKWDARTADGWGYLADNATAIVNLAGEGVADGRWSAARKQRIKESRLNAARAVIEAIEAAQTKPKVLIQSSAVGYYGPRGDEDIKENHPPGNDFLAKVCIAWEQASEPVEALGVRRVILRTGVVFDKNGGALPKMALPFKLFAGGPVGSGEQWIPWLHIEDQVKAIRFLINHPTASGPFNLAAPNPVTNAELGQLIGKVLHRPVFIPTPAFALKIIFGEMSSILLTGQKVVPQKLLDAGFTFTYPQPEAALEDLLK